MGRPSKDATPCALLNKNVQLYKECDFYSWRMEPCTQCRALYELADPPDYTRDVTIAPANYSGPHPFASLCSPYGAEDTKAFKEGRHTKAIPAKVGNRKIDVPRENGCVFEASTIKTYFASLALKKSKGKKTPAQTNQELAAAQARGTGPFAQAQPASAESVANADGGEGSGPVAQPLSLSPSPPEANPVDGPNDAEQKEAQREHDEGDEGGVAIEIDRTIEAIEAMGERA
jgi:hypothetical protein